MQISEFIKRADTLESKLSDMGFIKPDIDTWVRFCGYNIAIKASAEYHNGDRIESPLFKADEPEPVFEQIERWISEQPTPEQVREKNFLKLLARTIEEGKAVNTPILQDLEATMKRLSENIIEFQATA